MTHINQRRDTAANWTSTNPVLQLGEVGWETDTRKSKLGDGVTAWNDLGYTLSAIAATKADVGLGQVDNTSDMDKPVSSAQQTYIDAGDAALQAQDAALQAQVDAKAPIASPVFTGDPKAPTPATADNDTSIATTAFVKAQAYAPLASPVLTGDPKAPTPSAGDNDTSIATTAFVKAVLASMPVLALRRDAVQPIAANTETDIAWDTVEENIGFTVPTLPSTVPVVPRSGVYRIDGKGTAKPAAGSLLHVGLRVNGVTVDCLYRATMGATAPSPGIVEGARTIRLVAGNTVSLFLYTSVGDTFGGAVYGPRLSITFLRD